ncbi:MAG: hydantoinase B/oxoprolinase family protein, partial [Candidatus Promineifilaceae bacterium]
MSSAASLSIFNHLFASVAEEMGLTLRRTAYSPNIKERLDFSCALFWLPEKDRQHSAMGGPLMLAQAAHIPVHLGAMPASVRAAVAACDPLAPGDIVLLNDPYQGGNHLPDLTMVSPIFTIPGSDRPQFLAASRAHHADVGGMSPGSMPLSTELFQEGIIIPPLKLIAKGERNEAVWQLLLRNVRTPLEREGDLAAQIAAHTIGEQRMREIVERYGQDAVEENAGHLIAYAEQMTRQAIAAIPDGTYRFEDFLDDNGHTSEPVRIAAAISIVDEEMRVDFEGTAPAVRGNVNAVPAIAESAAIYCLRCTALALLAIDLPMNEGALRP